MNFLRCVFKVLILTGFYLVPLACAGPAKKTSLETISLLLDWKPNTNHSGFYVANSLKKYEKNGIHLKILNPTETSVATLVATGKADFGVSYVNNFVRAVNAGMPLVAIAGLYQRNPACFVWRRTAKIHNVRDFEGKRYAGWGSPEEAATLKFVMGKKGANFSKLHMQTIGINDFLVTTRHDADFTWEYKEWGILSAKLRHVPVDFYCPDKDFPEFRKPSPILITSEEYLKNHKKIVKKFMQATAFGYLLAEKSPSRAAQLFEKELPEIDKKLVSTSMKNLAKNVVGRAPYWGFIDGKSIQTYVRWMVSQKLTEKEIDYKKHVQDWKHLDQIR